MTTTTFETVRPDVDRPVIRLVVRCHDGAVLVFLRDTEGYVRFDRAALIYEVRDLTCEAIRAGVGITELATAEWDCVPVRLVP